MPGIPTKIHAYVDYIIALVLILSPLLFGFGTGGAETLIPIGFGMVLILYNFFTDYELGMSKQIPLWAHFRMDQLAGGLLATSPWVFNFYEIVYLPHLLLGITLVVSSLLAGHELQSLVNAIRNRTGSALPLINKSKV